MPLKKPRKSASRPPECGEYTPTGSPTATSAACASGRYRRDFVSNASSENLTDTRVRGATRQRFVRGFMQLRVPVRPLLAPEVGRGIRHRETWGGQDMAGRRSATRSLAAAIPGSAAARSESIGRSRGTPSGLLAASPRLSRPTSSHAPILRLPLLHPQTFVLSASDASGADADSRFDLQNTTSVRL